MSDEVGAVEVRPVAPSEQADVLALLKPFVEHKKLLRRTIDELDTLLPNGFVAVCDGRIVGFATLEIYSRKLAEVRALVVADDQRGKGVGRLLVAACIERAREKGYHGSDGDQLGGVVLSFVRLRLYTT